MRPVRSTPIDIPVRTEMSFDFRDVLASMPEDQSAVLLLVAVEGYAYREAAELLEVPIGTVMSRLSRARATLIERTGN